MGALVLDDAPLHDAPLHGTSPSHASNHGVKPRLLDLVRPNLPAQTAGAGGGGALPISSASVDSALTGRHGSTELMQVSARLKDAAQLITEANNLLIHAANGSAGERRRILTDIQHIKSALTVLESATIYAEKTARTWETSSDKDLGTHLGRITREGTREGRHSVARAITLHDLPVVAEGFTTGALTGTHVDVITKAFSNAPENVVKELTTPGVQAALVRDAQKLEPWQFAKALTRVVASLNPQAVEDEHQAQFRGRFFHVTDTPDGTFLKGFVDRSSGARLKLALEVLMHRPTKGDVDAGGEQFTSEQRFADALMGLADNTLNDARVKTGALLRPHVSVVIQESTWKALRSSNPNRGSKTGRGSGAAGLGGHRTPANPPPPGSALDVGARLVGHTPVTDDMGRVIPPSEVGRVLCDCELTRMVVNAESDLVDVGRANRLYANTQRRAVFIRDGGCSWQGCETPVRWCDVHHSQWWSKGGVTSVDNGIALCGFHHGQVHSRNLTITRYRCDELNLDQLNLDLLNVDGLNLDGLTFENLTEHGNDHLDQRDERDLDHRGENDTGRENERELLGQGRTLPKMDLPKTDLPKTHLAGSDPNGSTLVGSTPSRAKEPTLSGVGYVMTDPTGKVISRT